MKPEEYPSETFCKYTNIVTGVLEYFERRIRKSEATFCSHEHDEQVCQVS